MSILLFGFVLSSSVDDELITLRNKKVMANGRLLSADDVSAGWYFVHFKFPPKLSDLVKHGIAASTSSIVTRKWLKLYLESDEVKWLQSQYECDFAAVSIEDKLFLEEYEDEKKASLLSSEGWINSFSVECKAGFILPDFEMSSYERLGEGSYIIRFEKASTKSYIKSVLRSLSEMKEVASISVSHPAHLANRWAGAYVQDTQNGVSFIEKYPIIVWQSYPKINQQGLKGEGVVITVSDSGLDWNHTFFYDPNYPRIEYNKVLNGHRKIKYYWSYVDEVDYIGGHGTHVCGTVAGKANCNDCIEAEYNGIASDSKIAFVDIGSKENEEAIVQLPLNDLAEFARQQQSTILSASWGSTDNPLMRWYSDAVWYKYSDLLFVHAAGNEGSNQELDTIAGASSKNTLTVGSLSSVLAPGRRLFVVYDGDGYPLGYARQIPFHYAFTPVTWTYITNVCLEEGESSCIEVLPFNRFQRDWSYVCEFAKEHTNGNDVIITGLRMDEVHFLTVDQLDLYGIPAHNNPTFNLFVTEEDVNSDALVLDPVSPVVMTRADYSSQGATPVGILKPDVAAPGTNIVSSYSLNETSDPKNSPDHKGVEVMSGTSMATPLVSGSIALIQEYLEKGYYCSHAANPACNKFRKPSGVLLRSMIIASANRVEDDNKWPDPGMSYGFGVPDLSRVLPFDDSFSLHLVDGQHIENGEHLTAQFVSKGSGHDLILSLSYVDPPLSIDSRMPLSIDLNLYVETPSGNAWRGNMYSLEESLYYAPEHFSTNERIVIPSNAVEEGTYTIHVYSRDPLGIGADFSFACIGRNDQSRLLEFKSSKNAVCLPDRYVRKTGGNCVCGKAFAGRWCEVEVIEIPQNVQSPGIPLKSGGALYFSVSVPDGDTDIISIVHQRSYDERFTHHLIYFSEGDEAEIPIEFDSVESYEMSYVKTITGPKRMRIMIYNYSPFDDTLIITHSYYSPAPANSSSHWKNTLLIVIGFVLTGVFAGTSLILLIRLIRRPVRDEQQESREIDLVA